MAARPKLKITSPAYEVGESVFLQRGASMLEIKDHDGDVRALFSLLDGTRTVADLEHEFHARRPHSVFNVADALLLLDGRGVLVDATASAASDLDVYERERWKRNLGFYETYASLSRGQYEMQERVRDCKVALLGVGGVGTHVALDLMGLGIGDLRLVDFDKVELSNLNRQILYKESDIGHKKLDLAVSRLREYAPRSTITGMEMKLTSADDVVAAVADRDFVICFADRPKEHVVQWLNEGCVRSRVPFICGGVQTQRSVMYLIVPGVTGCVECWGRCNADDDLSKKLWEKVVALHAEDAGVGPDMAAFGAMVSVLTALVITEFVRYVAGISKPLALGRMIEVHFVDLVAREAERWERRADCPICKDVEPVGVA